MEAKSFKFQIILFGDYDEVVANSENINFFVEKFLPLNLLPKQIQEVSFNIKGKNPEDFKQEFVNRIGLNSFDKKWEIIFNKDNLNINYSFDYSALDEFDLVAFNSVIQKYLSLIEDKFKKTFFRIGIVIENLIPIEDKERNSVFLKFNQPLEYYSQNLPPIEWTNKVVIRKKLTELNNEIVNISNQNSFIEAKINSINKEFDFKGIHNVIDLNTLSFLTEKRFNKGNVKSFIDESSLIISSLLGNNKIDKQ